VGYCGGTTPAPTYRNIGDHAEALQLHFDPARVTFEDLLALFWQGHDPTYGKGSQYRAALFCNDESQLTAARNSVRDLEAEIGQRVVTEVLLGKPFHSAEAYHQKWRLRQRPALFEALLEHYPDEPTMLASTAAAKANAYVGGHGDTAWLERELPLLTKTA
jgi:peptide-methionine (S)-S-oxide reductase